MSKDVFISYSSKETAEANLLRNFLEQNNISYWMAPTSIPGGSNYIKEIPNAIRECSVFVLVLTSNAQKSRWIPAEVETAVNFGKMIIPFVIEECEMTDEFNFMLSRSQRIDAFEGKTEALNKLISIINANVPKMQKVTIGVDVKDEGYQTKTYKSDNSPSQNDETSKLIFEKKEAKKLEATENRFKEIERKYRATENKWVRIQNNNYVTEPEVKGSETVSLFNAYNNAPKRETFIEYNDYEREKKPKPSISTMQSFPLSGFKQTEKKQDFERRDIKRREERKEEDLNKTVALHPDFKRGGSL